MTPPTASSARKLKLLVRYVDFRFLRRHWCGTCAKPTVLHHPHRSLEHILREEWRS